jgi:predicted flap endonuclease-1-like 5' DNA nuclease
MLLSGGKEDAMGKKTVLAIILALAGASAIAEVSKLVDVEGIGPGNAAKLEKAGVATPEDLLGKAGTKSGRDHLAEATGISASQLLKWVNRVDLSRVKGVGTQYADLLEAAGVDTPKELARRNPDNLAEQLATVNASKKLVRQLPTSAQVAKWIADAKTLPARVEY